MQVDSVRIRWNGSLPSERGSDDPVAVARAMLDVDDAALDYGRAKLAFDQLVHPAADAAATMATLHRMADEARRLAGPSASPDQRFAAVRRLLFEAGPWNGHRPIADDQSDRMANAFPAS